jgi:hypothetical protein
MPKLTSFGDWSTDIHLRTRRVADDIRLHGTDDPDWLFSESVVAFWIRKEDAKRNTIYFCLNEEELQELVKFGQQVLDARSADIRP